MGVRRRTDGGRLRTPAAVPIDSRRFPAPGPAHRRRRVSPGGWLGSGLVRSGVERQEALDVWALRARAHFSPGVSIRGVEQAMSMLVPSAREMVRTLASAYPDTDVCVRALPWRCRCCERITPAFGLVHAGDCRTPVGTRDQGAHLALGPFDIYHRLRLLRHADRTWTCPSKAHRDHDRQHCRGHATDAASTATRARDAPTQSKHPRHVLLSPTDWLSGTHDVVSTCRSAPPRVSSYGRDGGHLRCAPTFYVVGERPPVGRSHHERRRGNRDTHRYEPGRRAAGC